MLHISIGCGGAPRGRRSGAMKKAGRGPEKGPARLMSRDDRLGKGLRLSRSDYGQPCVAVKLPMPTMPLSLNTVSAALEMPLSYRWPVKNTLPTSAVRLLLMA
jgi:hypothetical protein